MKWVLKMDSFGFPPQLDMFKAMAGELAVHEADENDCKSYLGKARLRGFLNRHPDIETKFSRQLEKQLAFANNLMLSKITFASWNQPSDSSGSPFSTSTTWMKRDSSSVSHPKRKFFVELVVVLHKSSMMERKS